MIERRIVRRYAAALFEAAEKDDVIDRIESDLGLVAYVMEMSPDLLRSINAPLVAVETKKQILSDVFGDKVDDITLNYMHLLVEKRRQEALLLTETEYVELANEARGILTAQVKTAVRLTDEQVEALTVKLQSLTGKKIHIVKKVDPALIAGVEVKIGDYVIDGSIKGRLAELRQRFAHSGE